MIKECTGNIARDETVYNDYRNVWNYCAVYIALFATAFLIIIGISNAYIYIYFHWYLDKIILLLLLILMLIPNQ